MSLVWHIARKDLRRLALPAALWTGFLVVPTIVLGAVVPDFQGVAGGGISSTVGIWTLWAKLLAAIQAVIGYLLAAALVLEDPLVGSTMYWRTRPISGGRLLGGKLLAASLLFIAMPLCALVPVWLASGFSAAEVWPAVGSFVRPQAAATLIALTLAAIARNFAQAMLFAAILFAAEFAMVWFSPISRDDAGALVRVARHTLSHSGMVPLFGFILAQQYLTLRRQRAWFGFAVMLVLAVGIRVAWPWELGSGLPSRSRQARQAETPEDRRAEISVAGELTRLSANALPTLFVQAPWQGSAGYVPAFARFADGTFARGAAGAGANEAGLRLLGLGRDAGRLEWQVMLPREPKRSGGTPLANGALEVWFARARVMGETPLRAGNGFTHGSTRLRIVELGRAERRLDAIFIEERESLATAQAGWEFDGLSRSAALREMDRVRHFDRYFIVDRAAGTAQGLAAAEFGRVDMNSLVVRYRRLGVAGGEDWANAALVKVRFECDRWFERPLAVRPAPSAQPLQP